MLPDMGVLECILLWCLERELSETLLKGGCYLPAVAKRSSEKVFTAEDLTSGRTFEVLHAPVVVKDFMKDHTFNSLWNQNLGATAGLAVQMDVKE